MSGEATASASGDHSESHVQFQVDPDEEDARSLRGQKERHFMMSGIKFERDNTEKLREFRMKGAYWWLTNFPSSSSTSAAKTWADVGLTLRLYSHGFFVAYLGNPKEAADFDKAVELFHKMEQVPFEDLPMPQKEALFVIAFYLTEGHYEGLDTKESEAAEESLNAVKLQIPAVRNGSFHD